MHRMGVDIGGTFTDLTSIDEASGEVSHLKVPTTPAQPEQGVLEALGRAGLRLEQVSFLSHGTTIGINAVLEGKGARSAILTTNGFKDVLELRRGARTHLLDPLMDKPPLFIPGRWRYEVKERVLWDGTVLVPLDEAELDGILEGLVRQGMESVAVCFLHSYANPVHEHKVAEVIEARFPGLYCTLSSDLVSELGEYERTSTAALNSYIQPLVARYLRHLETELKERGLQVTLHVMQSNGGVMTADEAARRPIHMLESGPAGGTVAAAYLGGLIGEKNLITFDMGGSTAKASIVEGGQPLTTVEFELFEEPNKPGSGWPIRVPMIDIVEIGAGGGSIVWLDEGRNLQVGPQSAGADPGPVCYEQGGEQPTITDANAILGRFTALLGGAMPLNVEEARRAMMEKIARPLGLSVEAAAAGALEITDAKAADLIREVTVARGRDPREFTLVAYGGAGPLEAAYIIYQIGLREAFIPPFPGNFSAFGLLCTDLAHDAVRTNITLVDRADPGLVNTHLREMEDELRERLLREGLPSKSILVTRTADLRYKGQFHIINVPIPQEEVTSTSLPGLVRDFHKEHLRLYTYESEGEPVELVNLRVRATGVLPRPPLQQLEQRDPNVALKGTREVYFREAAGALPCQIYERDLLGKDTVLEGPAIIEELTSTTLVPPSFTATIDKYGNIILRRAK
ncbi:MAG: hydantoinase/oxoprolinase family protein [Dehalococcoidia bacterium]